MTYKQMVFSTEWRKTSKATFFSRSRYTRLAESFRNAIRSDILQDIPTRLPTL